MNPAAPGLMRSKLGEGGVAEGVSMAHCDPIPNEARLRRDRLLRLGLDLNFCLEGEVVVGGAVVEEEGGDTAVDDDFVDESVVAFPLVFSLIVFSS